METKLRQLLQRPGAVLVPGAYDALSAKLIESMGFEAMSITGFGVAARHGFADVGLTTMTEVLNACKEIVNATSLPVIADVDTGYGGLINVKRTILEFEKVGAAGIHIEDQQFPKKCGSMVGRSVISIEEMIGRIKLAVDTRRDEDFVIIARTDAIASEGIDRAIERGLAYAAAGADAIMPMGPRSLDEMKKFNEAMALPTVLPLGETEKWVRHNPVWTLEQMEKVGFKLVLFPTSTVYSAAYAMKRTLQELKEKHTTNHLLNEMMTFQEITTLLGLPQVYEIEKEYGPLTQQ